MRRDYAVQSGFSLVEIIITIVIISIALTAAIAGWGTIAKHSADVMWQTRVSYLGQAYLEEITSRRYDENTPLGGSPPCSASTTPCTASGSFGPESGETRLSWDDVDDYHGLSEPAVGLFNELSLPATASYRGYQVDVEVTYVGGTLLTGGSADMAKQVTVTVTPPANTGQAPVQFSAIRGNY